MRGTGVAKRIAAGSTTRFTKPTNALTATQRQLGAVADVGFGNLTNATAVKFGGTAAATFSVNSGTQITATVANGTVT